MYIPAIRCVTLVMLVSCNITQIYLVSFPITALTVLYSNLKKRQDSDDLVLKVFTEVTIGTTLNVDKKSKDRPLRRIANVKIFIIIVQLVSHNNIG